MTYLMEAPTDGRRLVAQERAHPSRSRLRAARVRKGMRVADVGCGAGATLPAILDLVGPKGSVVAVDPSAARLDEARAMGLGGRVELVQAALPNTTLPTASVDVAWSQFVFEYLPEPQPAVEELIRITRPGGKVVVSDVDGLGRGMWPIPETVSVGTPGLFKALARTGFDPDAGRKLFHSFSMAGLTDIRVHLSSLYVAAGSADQRLIDDWKERLRLVAPIAAPEFQGAAAYERFCQDYLEALTAPDVLKFTIVLVTEGTRR